MWYIQSMNKKTLYIIAGANGSGKSTLAETILEKSNLKFLNADDIARELSPDAIDKVPITAGKIYFKRLNEYFNKNISFAVESTLSGNNIFRIISRAKQQNYKIILIYTFLKNCSICIERVKNRVKNGGHNVPEKDIIRRYYKSLIKFWNEYKNNVDEWTLFYNGFEYAPIIVSYGIKNDYVIMNTELQEQFNKILNNIEDS